MSKVIGLSGNIGSGKSSAAAILSEFGCYVIDADKLARQVVEPDQPAWQEIVATFGEDLLLADRSINRQKLGDLVFSDPEARKKLEAMTHPRIHAAMGAEIAEAMKQNPPAIILEIPLLFEGGSYRQFPQNLLIIADDDIRRQRIMKRDDISESAADSRMAAQMPQAEKISLATWHIENNGTIESLRQKITDWWGNVQKDAV